MVLSHVEETGSPALLVAWKPLERGHNYCGLVREEELVPTRDFTNVSMCEELTGIFCCHRGDFFFV